METWQNGGRGESTVAPPESRVSGKYNIYSVVEGDTSSFIPVERGPGASVELDRGLGKKVKPEKDCSLWN